MRERHKRIFEYLAEKLSFPKKTCTGAGIEPYSYGLKSHVSNNGEGGLRTLAECQLKALKSALIEEPSIAGHSNNKHENQTIFSSKIF